MPLWQGGFLKQQIPRKYHSVRQYNARFGVDMNTKSVLTLCKQSGTTYDSYN